MGEGKTTSSLSAVPKPALAKAGVVKDQNPLAQRAERPLDGGSVLLGL
jgi:hypothetical protein